MLLIGADPEIFAYKDGIPISAHGLIKGNKTNPYKVNNGAVQVDGMALEFNIDPASSEQEFVANINLVLAQLKEMVPEYDLRANPVADFGNDYIRHQPPEALELGCDPDYNAWRNGDVNPRPNGKQPFRTAAGHVHIGWTEGKDAFHPDHVEDCVMFTKELDYYLGMPSLLYDSERRRRLMYGAAGAFRPKSYGVEYRVLSNAWLRSKELTSWVYRNTTKCFENLAAGKSLVAEYGNLAERVLKAPNPSLPVLVRRLKKMRVELPPGIEV